MTRTAEFEAWAIENSYAYRNHQGFWFYRNGGDGLFAAWQAALSSSPARAEPEALSEPRRQLPPGWKVNVRSDLMRTVELIAPNGYSAVTTATSRNPENVLRMLVYDLIAQPAPAAQSEQSAALEAAHHGR